MPDMQIRHPELTDGEEILRWRNDDTTRAMSLSSDLIGLDAHLAWYRVFLEDKKQSAFVGAVDGCAIGWVRFDRKDSDAAYLVSITMAPEARSKGFGAHLLRMGLDEALTSDPSCSFIAVVRSQNVASQKIFQKCGFVLVKEDGDLMTFSLGQSSAGQQSQ